MNSSQNVIKRSKKKHVYTADPLEKDMTRHAKYFTAYLSDDSGMELSGIPLRYIDVEEAKLKEGFYAALESSDMHVSNKHKSLGSHFFHRILMSHRCCRCWLSVNRALFG